MTDPNVCHPAFVGGPGSGKSFVLGLCAVSYGLHSKRANIYVYAPQHHHIRTIEVPNVLYWLDKFKIKHKEYNKKENIIESEDARCGNFYFKPMDDPGALVGYESYAAFVDELDTLDENKAEEIWRAVLMRNRQQPEDVPKEYRIFDEDEDRWVCPNKTAAFTTPEGYRFCYKNWELREHRDYKLVKACTADNPSATKQYIRGVFDRFPDHVARAYLQGDFINMQSSSVYFNYNPELHDSFEEIRTGENLFVGCDFNVDNTSATIFVKRNGKEWHAVEELTGLRDAATLADILSNVYSKKGHAVTLYPDSSGKGRSNANASISAINELTNKGFLVRARSHNFPIDDRVNATNNAFKQGWLFVNRRNCPAVSRCLINQPYGLDGKPCKKTGYDHQNDATTYPIVFELGLRPRTFSIEFSFVQKR